MNAPDTDLLRRLADADAASPPPPGNAWAPADLAAAAARRARRHLAVIAGVLVIGAIATSVGVTRALDHEERERVQEELRGLRADVEALRAWLAARPARPSVERGDERWLAAAADLRYELANARAGAVLRKENR